MQAFLYTALSLKYQVVTSHLIGYVFGTQTTDSNIGNYKIIVLNGISNFTQVGIYICLLFSCIYLTYEIARDKNNTCYQKVDISINKPAYKSSNFYSICVLNLQTNRPIANQLHFFVLRNVTFRHLRFSLSFETNATVHHDKLWNLIQCNRAIVLRFKVSGTFSTFRAVYSERAPFLFP